MVLLARLLQGAPSVDWPEDWEELLLEALLAPRSPMVLLVSSEVSSCHS